MLPGKAARPDAEVLLGQVLHVVDHVAPVRLDPSGFGTETALRLSEAEGDLLHETVPVELAGDGNEEVGGAVPAGVIARHVLLRERLDRLASAENPVSERMPGPHDVREEIVDALVGRVFVGVDLVQDDLLLLLDVVGIQPGAEDEVRQDLDG